MATQASDDEQFNEEDYCEICGETDEDEVGIATGENGIEMRVCSYCDEGGSDYNGWGDKSDDDDGFEDCGCCGYTHHYEDKCPNEANQHLYDKWRAEPDKGQRCKKHDLFMYEDNENKCSKCYKEFGQDYVGKYAGDIYGCGYTGLSEQCNLCVKCNPKLWWLERRPTKLARMVKEFEV